MSLSLIIGTAIFLLALLIWRIDRSAFRSGYDYAYLEMECELAERKWAEELQRELEARKKN